MNRTVNLPRVIGVIPARWTSTRLPGKPLILLANKPMIQHVYERSSRATLLDRVLVATDDARIVEAVRRFGGDVVMTDPALPSGTDRVAEAVRDLPVDIVVNIQGDEPLIPPEAIDRAVRLLIDHPDEEMATLVTTVRSVDDLQSPHTAKVVLDEEDRALYFSRSPIPFCRDEIDLARWISHDGYWKHIGLYVYRKDFLLRFAGWEPGRLERLERLEQLRALEHGVRIRVAKTDYEPVCVDTPEDVARVQAIMGSGVIDGLPR